jgi:hypothetical protein
MHFFCCSDCVLLLLQFFLGDYRPLIRDTNGSVIDQVRLESNIFVKCYSAELVKKVTVFVKCYCAKLFILTICS